MKNHYGICEWSFPVSAPFSIQLAALAGFDGIQLGECGGRSFHYPLCQKYVQNAYLEASRKYNIALHSLNLGALLQSGDIFYAPETVRGSNARLSIQKGLDAACALGIERIVITASPESEPAYRNVVSHLKYAYSHAKMYQIQIIVETNLPPAGIKTLLEECRGNIRLCLDTLNPFRFHSGSPIDLIREFQSVTDHYHLKDSIRSLFHPDQRGCVLLGSGDAGFPAVCREIKKTGYTGWFFTENYYQLPPLNQSGDFLEYAKKDLHTLHETFEETSAH